MSRGLIFWILMLLWLLAILGALWWPMHANHIHAGGSVLLFLLLGLLGWDTYGPAVRS